MTTAETAEWLMQICSGCVKLVVTGKCIRLQMWYTTYAALDAWKGVYFDIFYIFNFNSFKLALRKWKWQVPHGEE